MSWQCKEPRHQQQWYWPNSAEITWFKYQMGWYVCYILEVSNGSTTQGFKLSVSLSFYWSSQTTVKSLIIRHTKFQNLNVSHVLQLSLVVLQLSLVVLQLSLHNLLKPYVRWSMKMYVGAALTGDAPTTSEWSTILLPVEVHLVLEIWLYLFNREIPQLESETFDKYVHDAKNYSCYRLLIYVPGNLRLRMYLSSESPLWFDP